ncbi:MAG: hypothetical protein MK209_08335 [Planctomycetes bacterium]|nr:hypothetical protein [Planctomycetota bacterium]
MLVSFPTSLVNPGSQGRPLLLLGLLGAAAGCVQNYPEPVSSEPFGPIPGQERLAEGPSLEDYMAQAIDPGIDRNALLVDLEKEQERFGNQAIYWKTFGGVSLAFAQEQEMRGETQALDMMLNDAEWAYGKALELDTEDIEARRGVVYARRMLGNFTGAWEACQPAIGRGASETLPIWDEELGRVGLALVIEAVQAAAPLPAAAVPAENALGRAIDQGSPAASIALADLLAWQGRGAEGREILIEALIRNPNQADAVGRLQNLTQGDAQVVAWERIAAANPDTPLVQWRLGEALWNLHWLHRQNRNWFGAHNALDRAESLFLAAKASEPSFASSCTDWLHLVRTAHGWVYWSQSLVDDAADAFLAAIEADPERLEPEPVSESLRLGIYSVDGHYFSQNRLDKARTFHRRLFDTYQDNPDWTNNYAFACREVASTLAQQSKAENAQLVWQESWRAYSRTVELAPNDVRFVNDRALIAVHYLEGDQHHELSEQELHRATRLGKKQLAQLAEDVPERERRLLDEAVGDAWENLAYLDVVRRQRLDRAESYLAEAVKHYPFESRLGVVRIRTELDRLRSENPTSDR